MDIVSFFSSLLDLSYPFELAAVDKVEQGGKVEQVELMIKISSDYVYSSPEGEICRIHSFDERVWRHLNLFEYPCYIRCKVPRYQDKSGKTYLLEVPWARPRSGFTLLFEGQIMTMIAMTHNVAAVACYLGEYPQRIWNLFHYYTDHHLPRVQEQPAAKVIGIDETSKRKGHNYISLFVDLDRTKILDIQDGKDSETIKRFRENYPHAEAIEALSIDMSPAFIKGATEYLPQAKITFDKFHVVKIVNEAFRKMYRNSSKQSLDIEALSFHQQMFQKLWQQQSIQEAAGFLQFWSDLASDYGLTNLSKTLNRHFDGIIEYIRSKITNAVLEGINNKVQLIKKTARGYRYVDTFKKMIFICFNQFQFNFDSIMST